MKTLVNLSDKVAITLSALCAFHCLAFPLLLIAIPAISSQLSYNEELLHLWLVFAVIPISLFAIISGYLQHKHNNILVLGACGMFILIVAAIFGHDFLGKTAETALTIIGSVVIVYGHLLNLAARRPKQAATANV